MNRRSPSLFVAPLFLALAGAGCKVCEVLGDGVAGPVVNAVKDRAKAEAGNEAATWRIAHLRGDGSEVSVPGGVVADLCKRVDATCHCKEKGCCLEELACKSMICAATPLAKTIVAATPPFQLP